MGHVREDVCGLAGWELEARARSRCCVSSEPLRGDFVGIG